MGLCGKYTGISRQSARIELAGFVERAFRMEGDSVRKPLLCYKLCSRWQVDDGKC